MSGWRKSKRHESRYVGKIGYAPAEALGLKKGHYVFVRSVHGGKCDVNTFTGIEDWNGHVEVPKVFGIAAGRIYPIPKRDCDLPRFSGVDSRVIKNVSLSDVEDLGRCHVKRRHWHYILRFLKG